MERPFADCADITMLRADQAAEVEGVEEAKGPEIADAEGVVLAN